MLNSTEKLEARETHKTIEEHKADQKFCFQIITKADGRRSEAFVCSWDDLAKTLASDECPLTEEDYILLAVVIDGEDTTIPKTPLLAVGTFLKMHGEANDE
mgnify:CR=1 FL=1